MGFRRRRTASTGLAVLALHLGGLWLLQAAVDRHRGLGATADSIPRVSVRLLVPSPSVAITQPLPRGKPATATATSAQPPARSQPRRNLTTNPRTQPHTAEPSNPNDRLSARPSNPAEPAAPAPAASAANALAGLPSLLDTEATRRAIRESVRAPSLAGRAAAATDEPARTSAQERLGNDVKSAGKGDCLKGDYGGTGMGLLSLPFLALAAARGACAP